ncbi:MAG: hypothetical protein QE493_04645 [Verrucomicrobiae bacterium]|nr:hypothetical protein [Verrucomicrobiae bacterium]
MNTALESYSYFDSKNAYSPASKHSPVLPYYFSRLPRYDHYEIFELE